MQELKVIGVESGALLLSGDGGTQYRVAVDDVLQARMRQATPDAGEGRKLAPKDIQAQIRAGLSAEDVAALTGADIDFVRRFEGPVIAEREYVIQSALAVPVRSAGEVDPLAPKESFGEVIRGRLVDLGALEERWASWKEQGGGWIVKLTFTANEIDHDARWSYDPRRNNLSPLNSEAETLSRVGDLPTELIPRLRAVPLEDTAPIEEPARFDSDAFDIEPQALQPRDEEPEAPAEPAAAKPSGTASLLEALRRRRGEREAAPTAAEESAPGASPSRFGAVSLIDIPLESSESDASQTSPASSASSVSSLIAKGGGRKGRAAMPSWDDIVFGARGDDE